MVVMPERLMGLIVDQDFVGPSPTNHPTPLGLKNIL